MNFLQAFQHTDDYKIDQNFKYEPQETTIEDNGIHGHEIAGLQTATDGHRRKEMPDQNIPLEVENSNQETTSTQDASDYIEVKREINSDGDRYVGNKTRHWVTCPGGLLKEVKGEHAITCSEILPDQDRSENVDNTDQVQNVKNHINIECKRM